MFQTQEIIIDDFLQFTENKERFYTPQKKKEKKIDTKIPPKSFVDFVLSVRLAQNEALSMKLQRRRIFTKTMMFQIHVKNIIDGFHR